MLSFHFKFEGCCSAGIACKLEVHRAAYTEIKPYFHCSNSKVKSMYHNFAKFHRNTSTIALNLDTRFKIHKPGRFGRLPSNPNLSAGGFESCADRSEDQSLLVLQCKHRPLGGWQHTWLMLVIVEMDMLPLLVVVVVAFCACLTSVLKQPCPKGSHKTSKQNRSQQYSNTLKPSGIVHDGCCSFECHRPQSCGTKCFWSFGNFSPRKRYFVTVRIIRLLPKKGR